MFGDITMTDAEDNSPRVLFILTGSQYLAHENEMLAEDRGCIVDLVYRGDFAIKHAAEKTYDLILMYELGVAPGDNQRLKEISPSGNPVERGIEFVRIIRESKKNGDTPIVVYGPFGNGEEKYRSAGANEVIVGFLDDVVGVFDRHALK